MMLVISIKFPLQRAVEWHAAGSQRAAAAGACLVRSSDAIGSAEVEAARPAPTLLSSRWTRLRSQSGCSPERHSESRYLWQPPCQHLDQRSLQASGSASDV